jgi:hypothetical protein
MEPSGTTTKNTKIDSSVSSSSSSSCNNSQSSSKQNSPNKTNDTNCNPGRGFMTKINVIRRASSGSYDLNNNNQTNKMLKNHNLDLNSNLNKNSTIKAKLDSGNGVELNSVEPLSSTLNNVNNNNSNISNKSLKNNTNSSKSGGKNSNKVTIMNDYPKKNTLLGLPLLCCTYFAAIYSLVIILFF